MPDIYERIDENLQIASSQRQAKWDWIQTNEPMLAELLLAFKGSTLGQIKDKQGRIIHE